jgi:mannonate dehydratase
LEVVRILRVTQFSGSICPDHLPSHPHDPGCFQAFAIPFGYFQGLIRVVNNEV